MGIFTTHSRENLVVETKLDVTYTGSNVSGSWSFSNGLNASMTWNNMLEFHRRASLTYRYIAMTEEAADACHAALTELFTRDTYVSFWQNGNWVVLKSGVAVTADISTRHNEDGSWDVCVNVREDDKRMMKIPYESAISALFDGSGKENRRLYFLPGHG